jgi:hypothetical protein
MVYDKRDSCIILLLGGIFMSENMTLLSQNEIDTLVEFLLEKKQEVHNEVLNQDSIDRLIHLIRTTHVNNIRTSSKVGDIKEKKRIYTALTIRDDVAQVCELVVNVLENGFLDVLILNQTTGNTYKVTPAGASEMTISDDDSQWGKCISPLTFVDIADAYDAKFSEETYQNICSIYANVKFGNTEYSIPDFFLPEEGAVAQALL